MDILEDKALIKALKNGDTKAFDKVYYKYHRKLYAFSFKFLKSKRDVEDLIQKIFVILWERRNTLDVNKSLGGYLFVIARNEIYDDLKTKIIKDHYTDYILNELEYNSEHDELEKKKKIELAYQLIDRLPERRAEIFRLSKEDGLTYKQIAEKLNISENTVDTQIRHSLNFLRKEMLKYQRFILLFFH